MSNNVSEKPYEIDEGNGKRSFGHAAAKGGMWVFAIKFSHRVLALIRTVILARLLSPNDFGLMGIAVIALNMVETFSNTGIEAALVQKEGDIKKHLDAAWTVQVIRSLVLFMLLYIGAPFIAGFFKSPQALNVIRVLAFLELFIGAKNIGIMYFQKELQFDKRFILEFSGLIANMALSIVLAFVLRNVWAIVYGSLLGALVTCGMSYVLHPYRPKFRFDFTRIKELLHFGKWIFGTSILIFIITQGDTAFVGRILGVAALGFYQMAYSLSNAPATEITHVVSQVTFPVYSKIQNDIQRLKKAYLEVLKLIGFISVPLSFGIFIFASDFTRIILGAKWMPMVPTMRILAVAGLLRSIAATTGSIFYAVGKPKVETLWQVIRLVTLLIFIYPLTIKWGIYGTGMAVCISIGIGALGFIFSVFRIIDLKLTDLGKPLFYPIVNALFFSIVIVMARGYLGALNMMSFSCLLVLGIVLYVAVWMLYEKFTDYGVYSIIRKRVQE